MGEYVQKYVALRKHNAEVAWKKAKNRKMCYLFLAPYAILFAMFFVFPVVASIYYSFTYYNILEPPRFIGLQNYISLILEDDIFLIGDLIKHIEFLRRYDHLRGGSCCSTGDAVHVAILFVTDIYRDRKP